MNSLTASVECVDENKTDVMHKIPGKSFCCQDIGLNCSCKIYGSTAQEIMKQFIDHAETAHNMQFLSADVIFKMQKAINK